MERRSSLSSYGVTFTDVHNMSPGLGRKPPLQRRQAVGKFTGKPELYWLITDDDARAEYENDPLVQRKFTPAFFCEFLNGMEYASANLKHPNNISPTLFLYGINDPVAGFGKGIRKIYTRYRAVNDQTEIESFPGAHDILHDEWREEVFKTIKEFLEK